MADELFSVRQESVLSEYNSECNDYSWWLTATERAHIASLLDCDGVNLLSLLTLAVMLIYGKLRI